MLRGMRGGGLKRRRDTEEAPTNAPLPDDAEAVKMCFKLIVPSFKRWVSSLADGDIIKLKKMLARYRGKTSEKLGEAVASLTPEYVTMMDTMYIQH